MDKIKSSLWGFNKKQVNLIIEDRKKANQSKVEELEKENISMEGEINRLIEQIEELKIRISKLDDKDFMSFVKTMSEEIEIKLEQCVENQIAAIIIEARQNENASEIENRNTVNSIKNYQRVIEDILGKLSDDKEVIRDSMVNVQNASSAVSFKEALTNTEVKSKFVGNFEDFWGEGSDNSENAEATEKNVRDNKSKIIDYINFKDGKEEQKNHQVKGSTAVETEIENARNRYILGKIAGKDLIGNNGELIISKSSRITEEVVNLAEREGKIADLILYMEIPEAK